jgi:multidrug transporter EmrE-like cation transporter
MIETIFYLALVVLLSLIGVVGDFFVKLAGSGTKFIELRWFIIGFLIYASTAFGWFFVMKHIKLATLGVFYAVSTVLFITIVGVFYFKESLNVYEVVGIVTAIISIVLLGRFA